MGERVGRPAGERQGTRIAVRFHAETTLDPAKLVSVVRSRTGIKLDPSGVLWMEVKRGAAIPAALRNVLLGLQWQGQTFEFRSLVRNLVRIAALSPAFPSPPLPPPPPSPPHTP